MSRTRLLAFRNGADRYPELIGQMFRLLAMAEALGSGGTGGPGGPPTTGHIPGGGLDNGRIATPEGRPPADLSDAIRAIWPRELWTDAARVAYYESTWSASAERNTLSRAGGRCGVVIGTLPDGTPYVSEDSVGYFQINICAHGGTRDYWRNATHNVAKAYQLYRERGWRPWLKTARDLRLL